MFLLSAIRKGLSGRFFPKIIARHPGVTTGNHPTLSQGVVKAKGVFIYMNHPRSWPLHIAVNALREHRNHRCKAHKAFHWLWNGALYARRHFTLDGTERTQIKP